jgi:GT2 family glycosyltransferase
MVQHYPALNRAPQPICSVCIANYNGVDLLADCLDSILAQTGGIDLEIIVHDDASTDDSVAWLRARYPQVELLASAENVGFCVGNNRMAAHARGEFLLLFNNDAALEPDALVTLHQLARASAHGAVLTLPQYDWATGVLVDRGCLLDPFYNPVPNLDAARSEVAMTIGACLWIARTAWNDIGGFPEWMQSIGEDLFVCCVNRLWGRLVLAAPLSGYRHRQGASFGGNRADKTSLNTTFRRRRLSECNKTAVLVICTPGPLVWPLLALHLCLLCSEGLLLALVKRDWAIFKNIYWPALVSPWRCARQWMPLRRSVQARRRSGMKSYFSMFLWRLRKLQLLTKFGIPRIRG